MCFMMDERSHSEGDASSVTVEFTEVTLPMASYLEGHYRKESENGVTCTLFLECG